eukprot:jgi/Mesvir1/9837/Mv22380-RA.1
MKRVPYTKLRVHLARTGVVHVDPNTTGQKPVAEQLADKIVSVTNVQMATSDEELARKLQEEELKVPRDRALTEDELAARRLQEELIVEDEFEQANQKFHADNDAKVAARAQREEEFLAKKSVGGEAAIDKDAAKRKPGGLLGRLSFSKSADAAS